MSTAIVDAISIYLGSRHPTATGVDQLEARLRSAARQRIEPHPAPAHPDHLATVLDEICADDDRLLADIGTAVRNAAGHLDWRVDDGHWYPPNAGVSDSYRFGNMHTILAEDHDFAMGLFLIAPHVDYLDHRHRAPEFYLNLTNGSRWRFDFGEWRDLAAGSVVWNESNSVHATRSGDSPWIGVWAWMSDLDQRCEVVTSPE